jgi:hypothetical protein
MTAIPSDRFDALLPGPSSTSASERLASLERALRHLAPAPLMAPDATAHPAQARADHALLRAWAGLSVVAILPFAGIGFLLETFPLLSLACLVAGAAVVPLLIRRAPEPMGLGSVLVVGALSGTTSLAAGMAVLLEGMMPGVVSSAAVAVTVIALAGLVATLAMGLAQGLSRHPAEAFVAWNLLLAGSLVPGSQGLL